MDLSLQETPQKINAKMRFRTFKIVSATNSWFAYQHRAVSSYTRRRVTPPPSLKPCGLQGDATFLRDRVKSCAQNVRAAVRRDENESALTVKVKPAAFAALVSCCSEKDNGLDFRGKFGKLFFFCLFPSTGSACEPPSRPLCFRKIAEHRVYCHWDMNTTGTAVMYDIYFK